MDSGVQRDLKLTRDFLQMIAEDRNFSLKPVVQIIAKHRSDNPSFIYIHLSDGISIYPDMYLMRRALEKFYHYGMERQNSIIKILDYQLTKTSREGIKKVDLTIYDFDLLERTFPIIGNPKVLGNTRTYLGNSEQRLALEVNKEGQKPLKRPRLSIPTGKSL